MLSKTQLNLAVDMVQMVWAPTLIVSKFHQQQRKQLLVNSLRMPWAFVDKLVYLQSQANQLIMMLLGKLFAVSDI